MTELYPGPFYLARSEREIKAALFDVDGTLVLPNTSDVASDAFNQIAIGRGAISLATGRPFNKSEHIINAAQMEGLSILSNGAQIYNGKNQEMLLEHTLPQPEVREIVLILQRLNIDHWVQDDGVDYTWQKERDATPEDLGSYAFAVDMWQPLQGNNKRVDPSYMPKKSFVIVAAKLTGEQVQLMDSIAQAFNDKGITSLIAHEADDENGYKTFEVFFIDKRANKGAALQIVAEETGITTEETMVVGDGPNDITIIEAAGVGVAMGNATPAVKEVANFIAPPLKNEGAVVALEHMLK